MSEEKCQCAHTREDHATLFGSCKGLMCECRWFRPRKYTNEERVAKMAEIIRAAGPTGLTGAEICERLGLAIDSEEADEAARQSGRMPLMVVGLRGNAQLYVWAGDPEPRAPGKDSP